MHFVFVVNKKRTKQNVSNVEEVPERSLSYVHAWV